MSSFFTLLLWAWLMASSFIVSGHMVEYASPVATSAFRFLLAMLIMLPVLLISWQRANLNKTEQLKALFASRLRLFHYVVISGALVGFFIGLFVALQSTTPLNTSVLYTLVPLIGVMIARVWLNEIAPLWRVVGFVLGSIGAMTVLFSTQDNNGFQWHSGDYIFMGACFLLALHVVSVQKWGRSLGALSGAFMIMLFGTLWLLPIALIWGELDQVQWSSQGFWVNVLYLTVFTTLFTFVLQQRLVMIVGASRLLAMSYTIPVWVALFTALVQSRLLSLVDWPFASGIVFLGIALFLIDGNLSKVKPTHGSNSTAK
ncbi:DMT family transporter [Marinomonas rhizomae]|uniref:EamA domain-containing membrane protein RarD n=1 Tax=Marinomonas rhizomae TaxID=491948 RepID=A0A366J4E7_9GAMM|nr:DMT family transporter [Marinomonas rhizomae]RBP81219.1 EamA domain-containing membrane protein RarD [Marinomonas rhizomae]RNF72371.1 DMT family transporter [Marinomonas rhizomae]